MYKIVKSKELQKTIERTALIRGIDPYSRSICEALVKPAKENTGIIFQVNGREIPANFRFISNSETDYTTTLQKGNTKIKTVEHLLSAIWGLGIDNAVIELNQGKIPFLDAAAYSYVKILKRAGGKKQNAYRKYLIFEKEKIFPYSLDPKRYAIFKPSQKLFIEAISKFSNIIGEQKFAHKWTPNVYVRDISWARSFLNSPILEGSSEKWERIRRKIKVLPENPKLSPIIVYTEKKYITPLKAPNECVRHKVLDFYGDIALLGIRILAEIKLFMPGHDFNREIVKLISKEIQDD